MAPIEPNLETWDLFISHASEDKRSFVAPLAEALSALGVNVWYDDYELKLGDSLSESLNAGLARSKYGLVVLSPAFIAKRWTGYELRGLTSREMIGEKIILPIWHNVDIKDVIQFNPHLADKIAVTTHSKTPAEIAIKIVETIRPDILTNVLRRIAHLQLRESATQESISTEKIIRSPIRHEELSPELISRIRLIRASLLGGYTHSMEFWVDGFQRDAHPSEQVQVWEHYAAVYREYVSMTKLSSEQQEAAFSLIFALGNGSNENSDVVIKSKLPADGAEILTGLFQHLWPIYDIDETLPDEPPPWPHDIFDEPGFEDKEIFPKDLPENLISDLYKAEKNRARIDDDKDNCNKILLFPKNE